MLGVIEFPNVPHTGKMSMEVLDPTGVAPANVIDSGDPFKVKVEWTIPQGQAQLMAGSFRLRVFAESIGPGPELQIGAEDLPQSRSH